MLKKFHLDYANVVDTPMATSTKLTKDEEGKNMGENILELSSYHFSVLPLVE